MNNLVRTHNELKIVIFKEIWDDNKYIPSISALKHLKQSGNF